MSHTVLAKVEDDGDSFEVRDSDLTRSLLNTSDCAHMKSTKLQVKYSNTQYGITEEREVKKTLIDVQDVDDESLCTDSDMKSSFKGLRESEDNVKHKINSQNILVSSVD